MNGFPLMTEASTNSISDRFGTATPDKTQIAPERANGTVITAYGGGKWSPHCTQSERNVTFVYRLS
jgi:hypothetical protein